MTRTQTKALFLALGLVLIGPILAWGQFQASDRILSPVRVGELVVGGAPATTRRALRRHADVWASEELVVHFDETEARLSRRELGAELEVQRALDELAQLGRSGNPLLDAGQALDALRGVLSLRWTPRVEAATLTAFLESHQRRLERLPIAGVSDGQGFSLPGRDGRALDLARATLLIQRALVSGAAEVEIPFHSVPAPPPITLGSPDGALFEGESDAATEPPPLVTGAPLRVPSAWLPENDDDCFDQSPERRFCDGPRRVPAPQGPAATHAANLGLGTLETLARLMRQGPSPSWIQAAGGPLGAMTLAWPVATGKLGRGFGYVRKAELKDRIHAGVDIVAARGSAIRAAAPGIVAYSDNRVRGYGNLLAIVHDNGAVTLSAHCQQIFVFAGERVERGQVVAEVGATGLALGPHLHFEYHVAGRASDPAPLFVH